MWTVHENNREREYVGVPGLTAKLKGEEVLE